MHILCKSIRFNSDTALYFDLAHYALHTVGDDPLARNTCGQTPLLCLLRSTDWERPPWHFDFFKLLVEHGSEWDTAFELVGEAVDRDLPPDYARALIRAGAPYTPSVRHPQWAHDMWRDRVRRRGAAAILSPRFRARTGMLKELAAMIAREVLRDE